MYEYYEDYEDDEDWGDPYPALRGVLAPAYRDLPAPHLEELLAEAGLSAEDMEFSLGKTLGSIARVALPVVGSAVGALGGPVGMALGGALGSAAGSAIGSATAGPARRRPPGRLPFPRVPGAPGVPGIPRPQGGSPAATQLLGLLQRPELVQALQAMALGGLGAPRVAVGPTPVPPAAFANLLGILAGEAAAEHHALVAGTDEAFPEYLVDGSGEAVVDVTDANERAARLLELIEQEAAAEAWQAWESWDEEDPEDLDAMYDAYELDEVSYG